MKVNSTPVFAAMCCFLVLFSSSGPAYGQEAATTESPAPQSTESPQPEEPCPKGKRGGAIAGIVVGSVFWLVLPMSIPVLITQSKKLKAHNKAKMERRCEYAPGS